MLYDAIIVGAGISGSFIANALTEAGLKCVMLEAGRDFTRTTYPRTEVDANSLLYWGGGIELTKDANIGLLRPKVVGGGSVVNQALLDRFDDDAFDSWRDASQVPFLTRADARSLVRPRRRRRSASARFRSSTPTATPRSFARASHATAIAARRWCARSATATSRTATAASSA